MVRSVDSKDSPACLPTKRRVSNHEAGRVSTNGVDR
jgi:hypothetical protein